MIAPKAKVLILKVKNTFPWYIKSLSKTLLAASLSVAWNCVFAQAPNISYQTPQVFTTNTPIATLTPKNVGGAVPQAKYGEVYTLSGTGQPGFADGNNLVAQYNAPRGLACDNSGNIYIADRDNNRIRKLTRMGVASTVAGSGAAGSVNLTGANASFTGPNGLVVAQDGTIYVADSGNQLIRKIATNGSVSTYAGNGMAGNVDGKQFAAFDFPNDVVIDNAGKIYISDYANEEIRMVGLDGVVHTVAGMPDIGNQNGTGPNVRFYNPGGIAIDGSGNIIICDVNNNIIRKMTPDSVVTTIAGNGVKSFANGPALSASFNYPASVAIDQAGNMYITDTFNYLIRRIDPSGNVSTLCGIQGVSGHNDNSRESATLGQMFGIATDNNGNLYASDGTYHCIRQISIYGYEIDKPLPAGLSFDETSGIISGTPTVASPSTNYTITAHNAAGSSSTIINITVNSAPLTAPAISYQSPQVYTVGAAIATLAPNNTGGAVPPNTYAQVTTFAGSGAQAQQDGTGTNASFNHPIRSVEDASGNLYVTDRDNGAIRKVTPAGAVTTFASGFNQPNGITITSNGDLYVSDAASNDIKLVKPDGTVSVFAGSGSQSYANGTGTGASFYYPYGITSDAADNLYVADSQNNLIRKITTPGAVVTTLAGSGNATFADGTGTQASFNKVDNVYFSPTGVLYSGDTFNNRIRKITLGGTVTTIAGTGATGYNDGPAASATFSSPGTTATDAAGNIYIADPGNFALRKIDKNGIVSTLAGTGSFGSADGIGKNASFGNFYGLNIDPSGFMYVTDFGNSKIRKISLTGYTIDQPLPPGLNFDPTTGIITGTPTAASPSTNYTITAYNLAGSNSAVVNITVNATPPVVVKPPDISYSTPNVYLVGKQINFLYCNNTGGDVPVGMYGMVTGFVGSGQPGAADGQELAATFNHPIRLGLDHNTGDFYAADRDNNLIRKIARQTATATTYAGGFNQPNGVAVAQNGDLYVADAASNSIKLVKTDGTVSTFAGGAQGYFNGTGTTAQFYYPYDITIDSFGNLFVADGGNNAIRKITPAGVVTTFAGNGTAGFVNGTGTQARFSYPSSITIDQQNNLFVADANNNSIRKITPAGLVTTVAGTGAAGQQDGPSGAATFNVPGGVAVDYGDDIFVGDANNHVIRRIDNKGFVTTVAGSGTSGDIDGLGTAAEFGRAYGAIVHPDGSLFVADPDNNKIRIVAITGFTIDKPLPPGLSMDPFTGKISGTPTTVEPATDYTVTAYNLGGSSSTVVNIRIVSPINFAQLPDKTVCTADFDAGVTGGTGTYTITSSNTSVATIVNGMIHITGAGTTTITATDGITTQSWPLNVINAVTPAISIALSGPAPCQSAQATFVATVSNAGTAPTYQWQVNGQPAGTNSNTFTSATLNNGDVINCVLTNTTDCTTGAATSNSLTFTPVIPQTASLTVQPSVTGRVAPETTITFTAIPVNGGTNPSYQWQLNGLNVGTNTPDYTYSCFSNGDVIICTMTTQGGGCNAPAIVTGSYTVYTTGTNSGSISISASANPIYKGQPVTFTATVTNSAITPVYEWQVNKVVVGSNSGSYTTTTAKNGDVVTCTLESDDCKVPRISNEIIMTVLVSPNVTIPTAFTPNDDGINDQWNIESLASYPNCIVDIFTRYGSAIFHSKGYSRPWDGTFNGNKLAPGTYYYVIDLGNNSPKLSGYVTLIR